MKINRTNYEAYLLDYLEGNLSDDLRRRVEIFLAANPDIAEEFESAKDGRPLPVEMSSVNKGSFYRSYADLNNIPEAKFEEFCVAYYEGDLDEEGKSRLLSLIQQDAGKKKIFDLYAVLRFSQDPLIHFPLKSKLKKPFTPTLRRIVYLSTAAAAALLISFWVFFPRPGKHIPDQQAQHITPVQQENPSANNNVSGTSESVEIPVNHSFVEQSQTRKLLAKADTNAHPIPESIILASIDPIPARLENELPASIKGATILDRPGTTAFSQNTESRNTPFNRGTRIESQSVIVNRETIFWSAVKASVKGFNTLTENDLALYTEQNKKGEVTQIKIYAENFQFQRRLKRTIQN